MTTEKWDHDANTRYPDFDDVILHCGKGDDWQDNPKYAYLFANIDSGDYREYWQFVKWLDSRLKPNMFEKSKGWLGNTLRSVLPPVIDF